MTLCKKVSQVPVFFILLFSKCQWSSTFEWIFQAANFSQTCSGSRLTFSIYGLPSALACSTFFMLVEYVRQSAFQLNVCVLRTPTQFSLDTHCNYISSFFLKIQVFWQNELMFCLLIASLFLCLLFNGNRVLNKCK